MQQTTDYPKYEEQVSRTAWIWANKHHVDQLDGATREGRPPVLTKEFACENVLVPHDHSKARDIRDAVPSSKRHRWFRSLKSSQALAQSVFGGLHAFGRLDLLRDVRSECGRPAFGDDCRGWALKFEHEVRGLREPTPTNVDLLLRGPESRIAIECKFTEREFGTCSRPRLRCNDARYDEQHCNGHYQVQRDRRSRCSLTEVGIRYWDHLPHLFKWPADKDHIPCPFESTYQLARNALVAALAPDGRPSPTTGHALIVYDARNPEFRGEGGASHQWERAIDACRMPGLLRRLSWQRLIAALSAAPELTYLVDGVREKYGLEPD